MKASEAYVLSEVNSDKVVLSVFQKIRDAASLGEVEIHHNIPGFVESKLKDLGYSVEPDLFPMTRKHTISWNRAQEPTTNPTIPATTGHTSTKG